MKTTKGGTNAMLNRRSLIALALGATAAAFALPAEAAYPDRPITMIVPFGPGGGSDLCARILAEYLPAEIGQSVVVENRPGAGANIGIAAVARSEPDGYTVLFTSSAIIVNPSMPRGAPYDPFKDFAPIVDVGAAPNVFVVRPDSEYKTLEDLIRISKEKPEGLNYATPGIGGVSHLATELFMAKSGAKMTHVPFDGAGAGIQGLLNGSIEVLIANMSSVLGPVQAGQLRAIGQTGPERFKDMPDVPTLKESGIDVEAATSNMIFVPAGTPEDVQKKLVETIQKVFAMPEVKAKVEKLGLPLANGGPDAVKARLDREIPMWAEVIKNTKLEAQ
jgi:tripartite-type tricarboxylate transporter receptor subunit TctC